MRDTPNPDTSPWQRNCGRVRAAIARCTNKRHPDYAGCGGRGIKVYEPWLWNPRAFVQYLMTLPDHDDPYLLLDRIDNDGHYEPGNLKFSTPSESQYNRRRPKRREARVRPEPLPRKKYRLRVPDEVELEPLIQLTFEPAAPDHRLHEAMDRIPKHLASVLYERYWCDKTLENVGDVLGLSRERVRQLEVLAVYKVRKELEAMC